MRSSLRRRVPEPLAELARPLLHPSTKERTLAARQLADAKTISSRFRTYLSIVYRRLRHVVGVRPALNPRLRRAEDELDKLRQTGRHGALTMGRHDWEHAWNRHGGPRVLMFAFKDYAGSLYDWADAVNTETNIAVRQAVIETSKFGFAADLIYPTTKSQHGLDQLFNLAQTADVIHVKDEFAYDEPERHAIIERLRATGRPMVFTQYGGYARSLQDDPGYRAYVSTFDKRIALTADLAFDWYDGIYIPHVHSIDQPPVTNWSDGRVVAHSPSTPERKGTDLLLSAIEVLRGQVTIELDLISDVSVLESLRRKRDATLFFDQAGRESTERLGTDRHIGWYGKSAVEAMGFGIPVMAHLSKTALAQAGAEFGASCPILNVEPTVESIARSLEAFFKVTPEERSAIADATAAWVKEFHGPRRIARLLEGVYRDVLR